jgi:hypothetical protein
MHVNSSQASYGMPRTVNPLLADFITSFDPVTSTNPIPQNATQRNFRVVHARDYIPDSLFLTEVTNATTGFPASTRFYRHVSPSYNISTLGGAFPKMAEVFLNDTDGTSQDTGNTLNQFISDFLLPHQFYLGQINACF